MTEFTEVELKEFAEQQENFKKSLVARINNSLVTNVIFDFEERVDQDGNRTVMDGPGTGATWELKVTGKWK